MVQRFFSSVVVYRGTFLCFLLERRSVVREKLAPFNDIVGVASSNVAAYSNGNDSFYSNEDYSLYGVYMGLKWQCVEYARRWTFVRKGSVFSSVEGAKDMWNQLTYVQRVVDQQRFALTRHENGSPHPPRNESYLIYPQQKDMPFGHVSVIVQVLPRAIRVAEQNFYFTYWKHHYAREIPVTRRDGRYYIEDKYQVYGWMEIDDSDKQLKPLNQATIDMIELKHQQNRALVSSCRTVLSSDSFLLLLSFFVSHAIFF